MWCSTGERERHVCCVWSVVHNIGAFRQSLGLHVRPTNTNHTVHQWSCNCEGSKRAPRPTLPAILLQFPGAMRERQPTA